jgi:hypothetical protein
MSGRSPVKTTCRRLPSVEAPDRVHDRGRSPPTGARTCGTGRFRAPGARSGASGWTRCSSGRCLRRPTGADGRAVLGAFPGGGGRRRCPSGATARGWGRGGCSPRMGPRGLAARRGAARTPRGGVGGRRASAGHSRAAHPSGPRRGRGLTVNRRRGHSPGVPTSHRPVCWPGAPVLCEGRAHGQRTHALGRRFLDQPLPSPPSSPWRRRSSPRRPGGGECTESARRVRRRSLTARVPMHRDFTSQSRRHRRTRGFPATPRLFPENVRQRARARQIVARCGRSDAHPGWALERDHLLRSSRSPLSPKARQAAATLSRQWTASSPPGRRRSSGSSASPMPTSP